MHPTLALSALFFLPLASALSNLAVSSQNATSGGSVTITWSPDKGDPSVYSLELANNNFHNTFALANNVQTDSGQITVTLPIVPADTYTLQAVQINNVNEVIGTSAPFPVGATVTTTSSGSSTSSTPSTSGSISGASASTTGSTSTSSGSSVSSGSSSPSASGSNFNGNGALGTHINSGSIGSIAAAVIGIVAGAVLV